MIDNQISHLILAFGILMDLYKKETKKLKLKNLSPMFTRIKFNLMIAFAAISIIAASTSSYTNMFGKKYHSNLDFTCCKGDQLYVHHFYTTQFFWLESNNGYTVEAVGNPTPGGCNVQCE